MDTPEKGREQNGARTPCGTSACFSSVLPGDGRLEGRESSLWGIPTLRILPRSFLSSALAFVIKMFAGCKKSEK
jgi:hypothetical protein